MGKNIQSEVHLQDHTFHKVFESIKDTMWICTPQGKLIDINPAGVARLG